MKYQKPEIRVVVSALDAVQEIGKEISMNPDYTEVWKTTSAYQADE
jgi:hypothetical protein